MPARIPVAARAQPCMAPSFQHPNLHGCSAEEPPPASSSCRQGLSLPTHACQDPTVCCVLSAAGMAKCYQTRTCMILLALNSSRRWMMYTLEAYLVRNTDSSMAESPPPITARGTFLQAQHGWVSSIARAPALHC